jgi:hypothetical protein
MTLTPRDKRMLQVLAVVVGLAAIYFLFTTVLGGGGGDEVASPTGVTGGGAVPSVSPTGSPSPEPRETLPPVVLAGARDPFSIPPGLELTPSGSVAPTDTTSPPTESPTATTSPPTGTTPPPTSPPPTSPPPTSPPPTSPPPPPEPTDEITIGGQRVVLEAVNPGRGRVQVRVDGQLWTVEEGALFAETFKLVRIDGMCARFLFGDQGFELCDP